MGGGGRQDLSWGVAEVYAHDLAGGLVALIVGGIGAIFEGIGGGFKLEMSYFCAV